MQNYTLTDACNRQGEVFEKAAIEPVVLTKESLPSHVIMSYEAYQQLLNKLTELEDILWAKAAQQALNKSPMVGEEKFTLTLQQLADQDGEA